MNKYQESEGREGDHTVPKPGGAQGSLVQGGGPEKDSRGAQLIAEGEGGRRSMGKPKEKAILATCWGRLIGPWRI